MIMQCVCEQFYTKSWKAEEWEKNKTEADIKDIHGKTAPQNKIAWKHCSKLKLQSKTWK